MSGLRAKKGEPAHRGKRVSEAEFRRMWLSDMPTGEIADRLGVQPQTVRQRARTRGLPPRGNAKPYAAKVDHDRLREMWKTDMTREQMAQEFGCNVSAIKRARDALALPERPRGGVRGGAAMLIDGRARLAIDMWRCGVALEAMAAHFGFSRSGMRLILKRLGVEPRKIGSPQESLSVLDYLQERLAERMAAGAARAQAEIIAREMADYVSVGPGASVVVGGKYARAAQ